MRPEQLPHAGMLIDDVMRRWPWTIRVLMRRRMLCIGCPIGIFHTVADAAAAQAMEAADLTAELLAAMKADPSADASSAFEVNAHNPESCEGEQSCA